MLAYVAVVVLRFVGGGIVWVWLCIDCGWLLLVVYDVAILGCGGC